MREFTPMEQAFYDLWTNGYRFLGDSDRDSFRYGVYKEDNGRVEGYTINGLMKRAETKKLKLCGENMTPEEVEMAFNFLKYLRTIKR